MEADTSLTQQEIQSKEDNPIRKQNFLSQTFKIEPNKKDLT